MKGKWAQGIVPRGFCWIIKDQIAVCERPGGFGPNHRRIRRQEEIIWIRENGFDVVISLLQSEHNLHNYEELGVRWLHWPISGPEDGQENLVACFEQLQAIVQSGQKVLIHREELGDHVSGLMAGYLLHTGLVPTGPKAVTVTEQLVERRLGPLAREMVAIVSGEDA